MRILIVDDDALICDGLKIILEMEEDFQVLGIAHNGNEAYNLCSRLHPDLVLMDIRMPECDGVLATTKIKQKYPDIKVVILTTFKDTEYISSALKCGAEGYILKSQKAESIIKSIRAVGNGSVVFEKEVAGMIPELIIKNNKKNPSDFELTEREFEIVRLIGSGKSNREISEELYISEGTVRNHLTIILEKLHLRDRTQLAIFYLKNLS